MAISLDTIRTITIQGEGQESLTSLAASVDKVTAAEQRLAGASGTTASVTDMASKRQLSAAEAYRRQTLMVDAGAAAQDRFAKQAKIADSALAQGKITADQHADRIGVLRQRYLDAGESSKTLSAATQGLGQAFGAAASMVTAFGLTLGVGALVSYAKQVLDTTANLQEQADQILGAGGNVEALQAFRGIFLTTGISVEAGDKIIGRLSRTLGEAAEGSNMAQEAFKQLHLGAQQLAGRTADSALPLVAVKLLEIEDSTKRAAAETAIFGKNGQQLESALTELAHPLDELIARAKALGVVIDADMIKKADDAKDSMALSWMQLSVALAPIIASWSKAFADFTTSIGGSKSKLDELISTLKEYASVAGLAGAGWVAGSPLGLPGKIGGAVAGAAIAGSAQNKDFVQAQMIAQTYGDTGFNLYAEPMPTISGPVNQGLVLQSRQNLPTESVTVSATRQAGTWAQTQEQIQAAAVAHAKELKNLQAIYAEQAKGVLDLDKRIADSAGDAAKAGLKQLETSQDYEREQAKIASNTDKYLDDLNSEVQLAGMSADERDRALAVMQGMRISQGTLTADQQHQIEGLVRARQETERWRQVVDGMANGFQDFFANILTNGKASFGDLWKAIQSQFAQMLAWMATQALIQPIIIPMVQAFGGAVGASGAGGLSGLGGLASLGGSGGLFGDTLSSGGFLGGGGLFNTLGSALGFATPLGGMAYSANLGGVAGTLSGSLPDIGAMQSGSLFGSLSLGSMLGGVGAGMLGSSLLFGNKNSASLGSMGGSAAGALAGTFLFPGVGTILGGLIGGLAGGGLGSMTGTSNQGAISNFTSNGLGNTLFKAGGGNNGQLATQATTAVNQVVQQLMDAGVNVAMGNISGISIGSDKSYVYGYDGMKEKLAGGDVNAVVSSVLGHILPSASGTDDSTNSLLQKYRDQGGINSGNVTQLIQDLQAAGQAKDQADQAAADLKTQADAFGPAVAAALKSITDPIAAQYDQLVASQQARKAQAAQLGADTSLLDKLDQAEFGKFLSGLDLDQLKQLNSTVNILGTSYYQQAQAAAELAQAQNDLTAAQQQAAQDDADMAQRVSDARNVLADSYNSELQSLQATIDKYQQLSQSLRGYLGTLGTSGSGAGGYASSRAAFSLLASQVPGGDPAVLGQLQQAGQGFLTASRSQSQTLAQYSRDRALVTGAVAQAIGISDARGYDASSQLDALNATVAGLLDVKTAVVDVKTAVAALQEALEEQGAQTASNTDKIAKLLQRVSEDGDALRVSNG